MPPRSEFESTEEGKIGKDISLNDDMNHNASVTNKPISTDTTRERDWTDVDIAMESSSSCLSASERLRRKSESDALTNRKNKEQDDELYVDFPSDGRSSFTKKQPRRRSIHNVLKSVFHSSATQQHEKDPGLSKSRRKNSCDNRGSKLRNTFHGRGNERDDAAFDDKNLSKTGPRRRRRRSRRTGSHERKFSSENDVDDDENKMNRLKSLFDTGKQFENDLHVNFPKGGRRRSFACDDDETDTGRAFFSFRSPQDLQDFENQREKLKEEREANANKQQRRFSLPGFTSCSTDTIQEETNKSSQNEQHVSKTPVNRPRFARRASLCNVRSERTFMMVATTVNFIFDDL